jgi:hypothetical protein
LFVPEKYILHSNIFSGHNTYAINLCPKYSWFLSDIALCNLSINGLWFNNSKFDMKKIVGGDSIKTSMHINSFDYDIYTNRRTNVRIYFLSQVIQKCIMAWSFKHSNKYSNIAKLVCNLFLFSCYFISKYIITCILIIINAILMSFRWMAELMV